MHKINITAFALLVAVFLAFTLLPRDEAAAGIEDLAEFPELSFETVISGDFAYDFENYLSDNVAYRGAMIAFARGIESFQGFRPDSGFIEMADGLLVFSDRLVEVFRRNPTVERGYAWHVSEIARRAHDGVRTFNLVVPTFAIFLEQNYLNMMDDQRDSLNYIRDSIRYFESVRQFGRPVHQVDLYAALSPHWFEYLFFRSDHHWTALGAYHAYVAFAEAAGLEPIPLFMFYEHRAFNFLGFLYNRRPIQSIADNPDIIYFYTLDHPAFDRLIIPPEGMVYSRVYETPALDRLHLPPYYVPPTYNLFMGGDFPLWFGEGMARNGRTAVIVKDSFANPFIPFLAAHYENLVVVDPRHVDGDFRLQELLLEYADVDLIILNYVFSATFTDMVYNMMRINRE